MKFSLLLMLGLGAVSVTAQTRINIQGQTKQADLSAFNSTKPAKTGTTLPSSCSSGELFFKIDAVPGSNLYGCVNGTWTLQGGSGGSSLPNMALSAGGVLTTNGTTAAWSAMGGDVSGTIDQATVSRIQNQPVAPGVPMNGQILTWDGNALVWKAQNPSAANLGNGLVTDIVGSTSVIAVDPGLIPQWYSQPGAPVGICVTGRDLSVDEQSGDFYDCAQGSWHLVGPTVRETVRMRVGGCTFDGAKHLGSSWTVPATSATPEGAGYTCGTESGPNPAGQRLSLLFPFTSAARAFASFELPQSWTGTASLAIDMFAASGTGTVSLLVEKACLAEGDSSDGASAVYRDPEFLTYANPPAGQMLRLSLSNLNFTNTQASTTPCAGSKTLSLRFSRDIGASDTFAGSVFVSNASAVVKHQ